MHPPMFVDELITSFDATLRPVRRVASDHDSMIAAKGAFTVIGEGRVAFSIQAGAGDLERAPHLWPGDLIEQEHLARFLARDEVDFEAESVVVNQHGSRA